MKYFVLLGLLFGGITAIVDNMYLSFPIISGAISLAILIKLLKGDVRPIITIFIVCSLIGTQILLSHANDNPFFLPHLVKILLLVIGAGVVGPFMTWRSLLTISKVAPILYLLQALLAYAAGIAYYYGQPPRFGIPFFGSPNTTAFVGAVCIALTLYPLTLALRTNNGAKVIWYGLILLSLLGVVMLTESNGGLLMAMVAIIVVLWRYIRGLVFGLVIFSLLPIILLSDFDTNAPEMLGSGRLLIWLALIENWMTSSINVLIGLGPGSINLEPGFTAKVISAHSMYVEMLVTFGVIGFAMLVAYLISAAHFIYNALPRLQPEQRSILIAMYTMVVVGMTYDSYLLAAQLVWLGALMHGMICLAKRSRHLPRLPNDITFSNNPIIRNNW